MSRRRRRIQDESFIPRRSTRLLQIKSRMDPSIPSNGLKLLDLPPDMVLSIADFIHDPDTPYVFNKNENSNWRLTIKKRPGHNTGGKATINPRRFGCQILFLIRPHAVFAAAHPYLKDILKLAPKPTTPMPLTVVDEKKGMVTGYKYFIQEQEGQGGMQEGWGTMTAECDLGYYIEWPRGIRCVL